LKRIIDEVVLDTGCSRALIGRIITSFLAHLEEKVGGGSPVYINGFGEMAVEIKTRRYYDINRGIQDSTTVSKNPKVKFIPSKEFLRYIAISDE
jgi:nucleoid DNA-binding protein